MLRVFLALLCFIALPGAAAAGAWLRETGATYLSYSLTLEDPDNSGAAVGFGAFYGEYGRSDTLTIGLDAGTSELGYTKMIAFGVTRLSPTEQATQVSAEFGIGMLDERAVIRPGLSVGRGITLFGQPGWISLDSRLALQVDAGHSHFSNDLTLGLRVGPRSQVIFQLQQGGPLDDSHYLRLVPTVVWERGPGRYLEIGAMAGLKSVPDIGLKIAIWRKF